MNHPVGHEHPHGHDAHDHHEHDHAHGHDDQHDRERGHEHGAHSHQHAAAEVAPPTNDNLILDIGGDTGALIIHATADRDQAEIEISPADGSLARTHNIVRRREAVSGARYAAVFPAVPAGEYVVWQDADTPAGTVVVHGGTVASFRVG